MSFKENSCQQISIVDSFFNLTFREQKALVKSWAKIFTDEIFPAIDEARFSVLYSDKASRPNVPVNVIYNVDLFHDCVNDFSSKIANIMNINGHIRRMDSMMIESNIRFLSRMELIYTCISRMVVYLSSLLQMELMAAVITRNIYKSVAKFITSQNAMCFDIPNFEGYSSDGLHSLTGKKEVNGSNYIFINSSSGYVKVKCEKDIYEKLVVDKHVSYPFSYRSLYYDNENGVLQGNIDIANAFSNDTPTEPPVITITNANMQLDYIIAKKVWRDEVYGGEDPFKAMLLNVSLDKIRYLEIGSTIKLNFMNRPPSKISVSDILLDKTGKLVISENALIDDRFSSSSEIYSFVVSQNLTSEISSYYVKNENIIRGLRVTATWGLKQCEYDFVIKTP